MTLPLTGGCQCGAVRYALSAAPFNVHVCYCRMCQRAVGGPFAALAPVRRDQLTWTDGKPTLFHSSSVATRYHCATCGTPLGFAYDASPTMSVTVGSLDNPELAPPVRQYALEARPSWCEGIPVLPAEDIPFQVNGERIEVVSRQYPRGT